VRVIEDLARTVEKNAPDEHSTAPGSPSNQLFLVLEGTRPLAGGARYELDELDEVTVGRGTRREHRREGRRLALKVPDAQMSTTHARFVRGTDGWAVEDASSTNGTFVDGARTSRASLHDGAVVDMGSTVFTVWFECTTPVKLLPDVESVRLSGRAAGLASLVPEVDYGLKALARVAVSTVFVVLLGETGSGKEVLARGIHAGSGRKGAFVPVNCGAIPANLVESQLFGHLKGSFSGALRDEPGLVLSSDKGTLLLDEIGDLPASSQAALLRVLQEHEVTPVGSTRPVPVDLRVVSATHRPIATLAGSEAFRADLYARLAGYVHELPPLRERKPDLGMIVAEIMPRIANVKAEKLRFDVELSRALMAYDWPLNVRELAQALATIAVFATDGRMRISRAPEAIRNAQLEPPKRASVPSSAREGDEGLRQALLHSLERHGGNVSQVARDMGRTRMQIHRWMRRFGVDPASYRK